MSSQSTNGAVGPLEVEASCAELSGSAILQAAGNGDETSLIQLGRRYFTELDRATHPGMFVLDVDLLSLIQKLLNTLKRRVMLRREHLYANPIQLPSVEIAGVKRISNLMLGLLARTFSATCGQSEILDLIGRTHDLFSWGGLRTPKVAGVRVPNNVPDGAAICFFAEFAHLAMDTGTDVQKWATLLPIFTRMPALFLKAHELADASIFPRSFDEFGPPPDRMDHFPKLQEYAKELRANFHPLRKDELGAVLGLLARRAFNDVEKVIQHKSRKL